MYYGWVKWNECVHWWLSKTHPTESLGESHRTRVIPQGGWAGVFKFYLEFAGTRRELF